ncbi:sugar nucleotide-binding protein [Methylorubrum extorquens]|nr:sugar nucleotide-binding protein [Methylorubrum extorquens]UYW30155.1 sugar nucleotide-binding protein [Methylorubrum extorquens]
MDILILGGAGQVGTELQAFPWPDAVRVHAPKHKRSTLIEATLTSDHASTAQRPADLCLYTQGLRDAYGLAPRPWETALDDILDRLVEPVLSN